MTDGSRSGAAARVMRAWTEVAANAARVLHDRPCQDVAVAGWQLAGVAPADGVESVRRAADGLRDVMVALSAPLSVDDFVAFVDRAEPRPAFTYTGAKADAAPPELVAALWVLAAVVERAPVDDIDVVVGRSVVAHATATLPPGGEGGIWSLSAGVELVELFGGQVSTAEGRVTVEVPLISGADAATS